MDSYQSVCERLNIDQEIWLCGLDIISIGLIRFLEEKGITVRGVLDFRADEEVITAGMMLIPFARIDSLNEDSFFVITEFRERKRKQYQERIEAQFGKGHYFVFCNTTEIRIDISGRCNLHCPSCQVANHGKDEFDYRNRGFMSAALFNKILDKLTAEILDIPAIYLFALGEPLLHLQVSDFVRSIHERNMLAVLSSNLSMKTDLESLVECGPDVLKISVSGFTQDVYGTTHAGGNIERVKENMIRLSRMIRQKRKKICVLAGYHVYNNNRGKEMESMARLCKSCGFIFQPVKAVYFNMLKRTGYTPFLPEEVEFIRTYYDNPEEILSAKPIRDDIENVICRNQRHKLFIDYDGKVMLCELFHRDGVYKNYLETTLEEIQEWRRNHWICRRCKEYDMHLK